MKKPKRFLNVVGPSYAKRLHYFDSLEALANDINSQSVSYISEHYTYSKKEHKKHKPFLLFMESLGAFFALMLLRLASVIPEVSKKNVISIYNDTRRRLESDLKEKAPDIFYGMTKGYNDYEDEAIQATINENTQLINQMMDYYKDQVVSAVNRSFINLGNKDDLLEEISSIYDRTINKSKIITNDQPNHINELSTRIFCEQAGLNYATWYHSFAVKTPRPDHVAANGDIFLISKGCLISGEYIYPGEKINCKCLYRIGLPY
jgi:hypothetical protein